ncbi:MAG: OmpA family protein [Proteobacteria bacterium]|nr:OmpA family protein [Pseudomonadota bacterium]
MRMLTLLALFAPLAASAQDGFNAHGFELAPGDLDVADPLSVWRPEAQVKGSWSANGLFEYAKSPLVLATATGEDTYTTETLLDNVVALNMGGQYAVHERVGIALSLPMFLTSSGSDGGQGAALGDARLYVPVTLIAAADDTSGEGNFGLSVIPFADLPTGAEGKFLGNGGFGGGLLGAVGYGYGPIQVSLNLGFQANPSMEFENLQGGAQLLSGAALSFLPSDTLGIRLESTLRPTLSSNQYKLTESPGEVIASVRGKMDNGFRWTGGAATAYTRGASAATFRLFAGAGYTWGKDGQQDTDLDGLADRDDSCPDEPEVINDFEDGDGCPDALGDHKLIVRNPDGELLTGAEVFLDGESVGRTDENGAFDRSNLPPGQSNTLEVRTNPKTGFAPTESVSITIEPGEQQTEVQLDWMPGAVKVITRSEEGAIVDSVVVFRGPDKRAPEELGEDGEEIFVLSPGDWTLLISAETFGTERREVPIEPNTRSLIIIEVVMKPAIVQVTTEEVVILDQVHFEFAKAVIQDQSKQLLTEVANNLLAHPEIKAVQVQGHTDSKGSNRYNQRLSQQRVDAVVSFMAGLGVEAERMSAVGYGEGCPIDVNSTDEGRANNRRVQFIITDPIPSSGIPCQDGAPARRAESITIEKTEQAPTEE